MTRRKPAVAPTPPGFVWPPGTCALTHHVVAMSEAPGKVVTPRRGDPRPSGTKVYPTVALRGLYAVSDRSAENEGAPLFVVTHLPTGCRVSVYYAQAAAVRACGLWDRLGGTGGSGWPWGCIGVSPAEVGDALGATLAEVLRRVPVRVPRATPPVRGAR